MLLISPPVVKPCEPPPGIAKLSGALHSCGLPCTVWDASLEGLLSILDRPPTSSDTWTHRAARNLSSHLRSMREESVYRRFPRYQRAVMDLNRLAHKAGISRMVDLSLANFQHRVLSPVRSQDLIQAAERPEDNPFFPSFSRKIRQILEEVNPPVVGFSLNYLNQALSAFAMMGFVRRNFPGLPLALGGGLVTSWGRRPGWRNPFAGLVDLLAAGPGEVPLLSLLGLRKAPGEINARPDYGGFALKDYLSPGFILPYSTSSGCYWNRCLFCPERAEGNPYFPTPIDQVMMEVRALIAEEKPILVHFLDNAISPALMGRLIQDPLDVPWYGFARFTDHLADPGFCLALKKSGCIMLQVGLESGDQGVLDQLQKGIDLEVASRALKNLKKAGIAAYIYLLFGTPAEAEPEARKTLEFSARHSDQIGFLNLAIFNLPAYGPEVEKFQTQEFYEGDLSLYSNFSHPRGWNRGRVRSFLDGEFKRHPAIAPIVKRDPPLFTSNHAAFFCSGLRK
jgi:hypothetical protein